MGATGRRERAVMVDEEEGSRLTSAEDANPSSKLKNGDKPPFLTRVIDGIPHAHVEGVHREDTRENTLVVP